MSQDPAGIRGITTRGVCAYFFGPDVDDSDPMSVLGLSNEPRDQGEIIAALNARLVQLAAHPDSASPHADEARFRLHASAAKVMAPSASSRGRFTSQQQAQGDSALQGALLRTVAMHGGWNRGALRMSLLIARSMGAGPDELLGALGSLRHRPWEVQTHPQNKSASATMAGPTGDVSAGGDKVHPSHGPSTGASSGQRPLASVLEPLPEADEVEEFDPSRRVIAAGAWVIGGLLAVLLAGAALMVVISRVEDKAGQHSAAGDAGDATPGPVAAAGGVEPTRPRYAPPARVLREDGSAQANGAVPKWEDRLRDLETAIGLLRTGQPEAVYAAGAASDAMSREWAAASQDQRRAGVNLCIESVYAAAGAAQPMLIGHMLAPATKAAESALVSPQELTAGVWSAGLLARLGSDRDLPYSALQEVRQAGAKVFAHTGQPAENSFDAGAAAMLLSLTRTLTGITRGTDPDLKVYEGAWKAWIEALNALRGKGSELQVRTTLAALDALLTTGAEPTHSRAVYEAVSQLVQSVDWRDGDESRRWLIRVFDDRAYSTADIHALTSTLAGKSAAAGVDPTMVLHLGAFGDARAMLRDAYASAWGLSTTVTRDAGLQRWREVVASESSGGLVQPGTFLEGSPVEMLLAAHRLARINGAAMAIWLGESSAAHDLLENPDGGLSARVASIATHTAGRTMIDAPAGLTQWGVSYMQAGTRIPERARLLGQHFEPLTWADAQVIAWEAFYAPQEAISTPARLLLRRYAGSPQMLSAVLDLAPMLPQTHTSNELLSMVAATTLPSVRDSRWRVAVRRDLVARYIEAIADTGSLRAVEEIARAIAEVYEQQAMPSFAGMAAGRVQPNPQPTVQAGKLLARWDQESQGVIPSGREPMSLQAMNAARAARARVSTGDVQEFVAVQAAIAERMAFVFVAQRPAAGEPAGVILNEMRDELRSVSHVFGQILACERAICRLWVLHHGQATPEGEGA